VIGSGDLDHRIRFERRAAVGGSNPDGQAAGGWATLFDRWARVEGKTGGETLGGRLEGVSAWEVVVYKDPDTDGILETDRIHDLGDGGLYWNIKSKLPYPPDPRAFWLITAQAGGANG
jgi:head-tail adaptor